jgi:hypothetical protein
MPKSYCGAIVIRQDAQPGAQLLLCNMELGTKPDSGETERNTAGKGHREAAGARAGQPAHPIPVHCVINASSACSRTPKKLFNSATCVSTAVRAASDSGCARFTARIILFLAVCSSDTNSNTCAS